MEDNLLKEIITKNGTRIVLVVADGLGGLPSPETGLTELETAKTPNLDRLAKTGSAGLSVPIGYGVTPGSVGHPLVKSGLEERHARHRGQSFAEEAQAFRIGRIVRGRQIGGVAERLFDPFIGEQAAGEVASGFPSSGAPAPLRPVVRRP